MNLQIKKLKEDDKQFDCKKGDFVLVDMDYDWDDEKVIGVLNLSSLKKLSNSFYKSELKNVGDDEFCEVWFK